MVYWLPLCGHGRNSSTGFPRMAYIRMYVILCGDEKGFVQCTAFEQDISFCSVSQCLQRLVISVSVFRDSSACAVLQSQLPVAVTGLSEGRSTIWWLGSTWHWPPLVAGKGSSRFILDLIFPEKDCQVIPLLPTGCGISVTTVTGNERQVIVIISPITSPSGREKKNPNSLIY